MSLQTLRALGLPLTAAIAMNCQGFLLAQQQCPRLMSLALVGSERMLGLLSVRKMGSVDSGSRDLVEWPELRTRGEYSSDGSL